MLQQEIDKTQAMCTNVPLTREDIAQVVESWTKIPVHRLSTEESEKLVHLEERLHQRVIGQEAAVNAVARGDSAQPFRISEGAQDRLP